MSDIENLLPSDEKGVDKTSKELIAYSNRRSAIANMVAHFAVVFFTCFMAYKSPPEWSLFPWHPFLMTLAYVLFMTEAILFFSQQSGLIQGSRVIQVRSHWIFQVLMCLCSTGGFIAVFLNKNNRGKFHFTTWHGLIGLVTYISCLTQALAGVFLLYPKLLSKITTLVKAKVYHATYGLLNYTLVVLVLNLGLWSNWANRNIHGVWWYACVACVDVLGLVVMTQVTNNVLPRLRVTRK